MSYPCCFAGISMSTCGWSCVVGLLVIFKIVFSIFVVLDFVFVFAFLPALDLLWLDLLAF